MSRIKHRWTSIEKKVHNYLKGNRVKHKMHPKETPGADILVTDKKMAVFLHGCFWHGCKKCYREPKSNVEFWRNKALRNKMRDRRARTFYEERGYKVVIIWEHELKHNFEGAMERIVFRRGN